MSLPQLALTFAAATLLGLAAQRLGLPGGLILGSMVGAAAVTIATNVQAHPPAVLQTGAFIVIGTAIGVLVTRQALAALVPVFLPAVLSAALLIAAGLAVAYLLRLVGIAPPGDVLATSPGALSVLTAVAVEQGAGAAEVALFHLVRIVLVIVSLPLLVQLLRLLP